MRKIFIGALLLMLVFSGVTMAGSTNGNDPIGRGSMNATIVIEGAAEFLLLEGEFLLLHVRPLYNSTSNFANWGLLTNRPQSIRVHFESVGVPSGGIPEWAASLFEYTVTAGTWSDGFVYDGEYTPDPGKETSFEAFDGSNLTGLTRDSRGYIWGQIQLAFTVPDPDNQGQPWELPSGEDWLDLGDFAEDGTPTTYADIIQVTVYEQ